MNPACVAMRPKLDVLMALFVDSLPKLRRVRQVEDLESNLPDMVPCEPGVFREHEVDVLAELIESAVDRARRVAVLSRSRIHERGGIEESRVGMCRRGDAVCVAARVFGSPMRFGRCWPPRGPRSAADVPLLITAFNGDPLTNSAIADAFHPPNRAYVRLR